MNLQVKKICNVCLALIFIHNLHTISADSILTNFPSRVLSSVSRLYRGADETNASSEQNRKEDTSMTPMDIIRNDNYTAEVHNVVTEDGYILTIYRIPGKAKSTPVFMQHGLLESAPDFLYPGRGRSLAYLLSDNGYDVWLGNARGNTYSRDHETLSTSDPQFWDFSWEELGRYDLPAVITYITELTNESLFYVGHSMAGTSISVMAIERPDVAKKVKAVFALAPATYVYYIRTPLKLLAPFNLEFQRLANAVGIYEFLPRSIFFDIFAMYICKSIMFQNILCSNSLFLLAGFSPDQLDYSLLPQIWSRFPAGTSIKLFTHWLQQMNVNKFRRFDYGSQENLKKYNSTEPPEYDLSKMQIPVMIFWSENDQLVGAKDIQNFYNQLPNKLGIHKVADKKFNHFDFLWAIDAPELVYNKIFKMMAELNNQV